MTTSEYFGKYFQGQNWKKPTLPTIDVYLYGHEGIVLSSIDWCINNCKHRWGWCFDNFPPNIDEIIEKLSADEFVHRTPIMKFESKQEAIEFKLYCL